MKLSKKDPAAINIIACVRIVIIISRSASKKIGLGCSYCNGSCDWCRKPLDSATETTEPYPKHNRAVSYATQMKLRIVKKYHVISENKDFFRLNFFGYFFIFFCILSCPEDIANLLLAECNFFF